SEPRPPWPASTDQGGARIPSETPSQAQEYAEQYYRRGYRAVTSGYARSRPPGRGVPCVGPPAEGGSRLVVRRKCRLIVMLVKRGRIGAGTAPVTELRPPQSHGRSVR